jgi:hypothetical protein
MAKRKGAKKGKTSRRRRVSGMSGASSETIKTFGGIMLGVIGGSMLASKVAPNVDAKIKGVVLAAAGLFGASKVHGSLMTGIALGVSVAGGTAALKGFGIISGSSANRLMAGNVGMRQVNGGMVNGGMVNGGLGTRQVNGFRNNEAENMAYAMASI